MCSLEMHPSLGWKPATSSPSSPVEPMGRRRALPRSSATPQRKNGSLTGIWCGMRRTIVYFPCLERDDSLNTRRRNGRHGRRQPCSGREARPPRRRRTRRSRSLGMFQKAGPQVHVLVKVRISTLPIDGIDLSSSLRQGSLRKDRCSKPLKRGLRAVSPLLNSCPPCHCSPSSKTGDGIRMRGVFGDALPGIAVIRRREQPADRRACFSFTAPTASHPHSQRVAVNLQQRDNAKP